MNLKQLSNEDIGKVYNMHMIVDFPSEELKPIDVIQNLIKRKNYICYGLYNNEELLAYAFLATSKLYLLIDYYSVCAKYRNKGIGSEFLNILKEHCKNYNGIIVEVENIECARDETEKIVRKRRIDFYRKNGMRMTKILSKLFNVNYSIMCLCNIEIDDSVIYAELKNIYKEMIPSKFYSKYVEVRYKTKK
ncbi:MAG TPA: GNAT family N-acetyltransferase [Clostridium sp.]